MDFECEKYQLRMATMREILDMLIAFGRKKQEQCIASERQMQELGVGMRKDAVEKIIDALINYLKSEACFVISRMVVTQYQRVDVRPEAA